MKSDDIVITSAFRTAIGSFNGSLSSKTAPELGSTVIKKCVQDSGLKKEEVDMVYMGQVLTAGVGQNPARQSTILQDFQMKRLTQRSIKFVDQDLHLLP